MALSDEASNDVLEEPETPPTRRTTLQAYNALRENRTEAAKHARNLFMGHLAVQSYALIVLAGMTDRMFFDGGHSQMLPVLNVSVSLGWFLPALSALSLVVFLYWQFYLRKMWLLDARVQATARGHEEHPEFVPPDGPFRYPWAGFFARETDDSVLRMASPAFGVLQWLLMPLVQQLCCARAIRLGSERRPDLWISGLPWGPYFVALLVVSVWLTWRLRSQQLSLASASAAARRGSPPQSTAPWRPPLRALSRVAALSASAALFVGPLWAARAYPLQLTYLQAHRDLRRMDLEQAQLRAANLGGSDLQKANLQKANLWQASLQEANLQKANLWGAFLQEANLNGAYLYEADLRRKNLQKAKLQKAKLQGADLRGADLRGAYLQGAYLQGAYLQGVRLVGADLSGAHLDGANFGGANLGGAKFQGAYLSGAFLQEANFYEAHFQKANLHEAHLQGAGLVEANLTKANLWGAFLQDASLLRANLQGARLQEAYLQGADLRGADLQGANLYDAILHGADLEGVTYDDATVWPEGFVPPPSARLVPTPAP